MSAITQAMYKKYAKYYDLIYWKKDYKKEAKYIAGLIRKYKKSDGNNLIEFACGTGKHLQYFARDFKCTGTDINKGMLPIAKKRVPKAVFRQGNMINSRFGRKFDVVLCLFSSIGYVKTYANLKKTIRNFSRHLKKGGVVVIEPWLSPEGFKAGHVSMATYDSPDLKIARLNVSEKKGMVSRLDMHFLVAEKNKKVLHFIDRHELGLFSVPKTLALMKKAGLKAEFLKKGRGIYVGVKQ